jgi:hypothetical protein
MPSQRAGPTNCPFAAFPQLDRLLDPRKDGRIGPPKILDGRKLFAIEILDEFFEALPDETNDAAEDWTVGV